MSLSRRAFLAGLVTATIGSTTAAGQERVDWREEIPTSVMIDFDRSVLEAYQPVLDLREVDRAKVLAMYGLRARSPDRDTDAMVYWMKYSHQEGLSPFAPPLSDSHRGDHEPIIVYVNSTTGDVEEVVFSAYHWLRGGSPASGLTFTDDTHVRLAVVSPWHHYYPTDVSGTFVDAEDLTTDFQGWLDNGLNEHLHLPAVVRPWVMRSRPHWWQDTAGFSFDAWYARQFYRYEQTFGNAREADL